MERILVIADIHGNLDDLLYLTGRYDQSDHLYPCFEQEQFDTVFLLGDYIGDNPRYCSVADGDSVCGFISRTLAVLPGAGIIKGNHEQEEIDAGIRLHRAHTSFLQSLPATMVGVYGGVRVFCRHGFGKHQKDTGVCAMAAGDPDIKTARLVCFGHDHRARVFEENGIVFMNPGALMKQDGVQPGYAIVDIRERRCETKQIQPDGRLLTVAEHRL